MTESLETWLERVASPSPTPGGGSVAAVSGALSAALSRMVSNLSIGKQGYEEVEEELKALERRAAELQSRFLLLAEEDARAFEGVMTAMRRPKGTDEERAARKEAMQAAYKTATEVPLQTVRASMEALEIAQVAAGKGNRNAITDAGAAALLAQAAMRSASLNVRINLSAIADAAWRSEREDELAVLLDRGAQLAHAVDDLVESRL